MKQILLFFIFVLFSQIAISQVGMRSNNDGNLSLSLDQTYYFSEFQSYNIGAGYDFGNRVSVAAGFGGIQDEYRNGFFHFDGYFAAAQVGYSLWDMKKDEMPISFIPIARVQQTKVYGEGQQWLALGAKIGTQFAIGVVNFYPMIQSYWNKVNSQRDVFLQRGAFNSFGVSLGIEMKGAIVSPGFFSYGKGQNSFTLTVGRAISY